MKRRKAFKLAALTLVCALLAGVLAACAPAAATTPDTSTSTASTTPTSTTPEDTGITFPLKERFTFKVMFKGNYDFDNLMPKITFYQEIVEQTNVDFEWVLLGEEPMATLNGMLAAGTEGDVIFGGVLNDAAISDLASTGRLLPIEQYVTDPKIMPNYNERGLALVPEALGVMTAPDGHIYSLARLNINEANYVENYMNINTAWLKQVNKEIPKTLEEFEDVLRAFRDNDMNGNGNPNDEIPLFIANSTRTYSTPQALLGMWGIGTKSSALDSYTTVKNGVVSLAPMTDAYKEAIGTIGRWAKEGLIWSEAYTAGNTDTVAAKEKNDIPLYGVLLSSAPAETTSYYKDLEIIPYPKVEGYEPAVYLNPGLLGYKNTFTLTSKAKNPEIILHWLDTFYSLENSIKFNHGLPGEGRYDIVDGKYVFEQLDTATRENLKTERPTLSDTWGAYLGLYNALDYASQSVPVTSAQERNNIAYERYYKDIVNKEPWPRPYFTTEDSARANELRTDIFNIISMYEAQWATGQSDINAEWDKYLAELKAAGSDEFVEILQRAYDVYLKGMEQYAK